MAKKKDEEETDENFWTKSARLKHQQDGYGVKKHVFQPINGIQRCCVFTCHKLLFGSYGFRNGEPACDDHATD